MMMVVPVNMCRTGKNFVRSQVLSAPSMNDVTPAQQGSKLHHRLHQHVVMLLYEA
jgi:hypothetical protein